MAAVAPLYDFEFTSARRPARPGYVDGRPLCRDRPPSRCGLGRPDNEIDHAGGGRPCRRPRGATLTGPGIDADGNPVTLGLGRHPGRCGGGGVTQLAGVDHHGAAGRAGPYRRPEGRRDHVGTADRLQGGQWPLVVALDPAAAVGSDNEYAMSLGRLGVMISRHTHHLTWLSDASWPEVFTGPHQRRCPRRSGAADSMPPGNRSRAVMHNRVANHTRSANGHELHGRDWLADVWIVANLEAFEHEVHSLLTDQLDTVAAAAVRVMARRDQGEDEPVPPSAHLVELAAASDPVLGSGELDPPTADLLGYLIALVAGKLAGGRPVCWRDCRCQPASFLVPAYRSWGLPPKHDASGYCPHCPKTRSTPLSLLSGGSRWSIWSHCADRLTAAPAEAG